MWSLCTADDRYLLSQPVCFMPERDGFCREATTDSGSPSGRVTLSCLDIRHMTSSSVICLWRGCLRDPPRNWRSLQASDGGAVRDRVFPYLSVVDHASAGASGCVESVSGRGRAETLRA